MGPGSSTHSCRAGGLPQIRSVGLAGQDDRPRDHRSRAATSRPRSPATDGRSRSSPTGTAIRRSTCRISPSGEPRRLTQTKERESSPRFLPDGTLVYVTEAGRGKGSRVMRLEPGAPGPTVLVTTEHPILSLDVSLDGTRLIYVVGQPSEDAKGRGEFSMFIQPLAGGSAEEITLRAARAGRESGLLRALDPHRPRRSRAARRQRAPRAPRFALLMTSWCGSAPRRSTASISG